MSCLLAVAAAEPGVVGAAHLAAAPLAVAAAPVAVSTAAVIPPSISVQHHSQDELGQYSYGYNGGPSAKEEVRAVDGSVVGAYSYVDANGIVQSAQYASDPINGFRVAATNDPSPASSLALNAAPAIVAAAPAVVAAAPAVVAAAPAVVADARAALVAGLSAVPAVVSSGVIASPVGIDVASANAAHIAAKAALLGRRKRSPGILGLAGPVVAAGPGTVSITNPPFRSFSYSAVAAHPAQIVPAGPAIVAVAAPHSILGLHGYAHL